MPFRVLICVLWLAAGAIPAFADLPQPVLARLRAAGLPDDAMAAVVQRLSDGKTLVSHGAERSMQPASTMKLVTSLVALETLGPAFRGWTQVRTQGEVAGGVLRGDLFLRGGADVDLDWRAFEHMLQLLRLQGIRELRGDFVLDRTLFDPARTDVGAAPFDEAPEFRYNVIPDALLLNTNLIQLDLVSDDREARIATAPPLEDVTVVSDFKLVDRDCDDWEDGWVIPEVRTRRDGAIAIRLQGEFPRRCTASTAINVVERLAFADRLFRSAWKRLGGTFRGRTREGESPGDARVLAEHRSRPLGEVTRDINKRSDNPIARVIYLAIGANSALEPGMPTAQRAEALEEGTHPARAARGRAQGRGGERMGARVPGEPADRGGGWRDAQAPAREFRRGAQPHQDGNVARRERRRGLREGRRGRDLYRGGDRESPAREEAGCPADPRCARRLGGGR
jgi:D-alanyl-D-alanine carboxypeptidase/D-alanyl-D-alanine-endopeptidase (penicillin-binding protein 4)